MTIEKYNQLKKWIIEKLKNKDYIGNYYFHKGDKKTKSKLIAFLFMKYEDFSALKLSIEAEKESEGIEISTVKSNEEASIEKDWKIRDNA